MPAPERAADAAWTLAQLAEATGLTARTIRFYISRGLLPGPVTTGRGATYIEPHRQRLREIQALQTHGLALADIARRFREEGPAPLPALCPIDSYRAAEDVTVLVRGDLPPARQRQIRAALRQFVDLLHSPSNPGEPRE